MQRVTKERWSGHTNIRQNELQTKVVTKGKQWHFIIVSLSFKKTLKTYAPITALKIYAAETDRTKERNRGFQKDSWRCPTPLLVMDGTTRYTIGK